MSDRAIVEKVLADLYRFRCAGELGGLCAVFGEDAAFRIAGTSAGKPIAMSALGMNDVQPWLALLVKSFKVSDRVVLTCLIDGDKAAVHWQADILSRITGAVVPTEFFDFVEIRGTSVISYVELFVPR